MLLRRRITPLVTLILSLLTLTAPPALAATECKPVAGIGPEIAKFLDQVAAAQKAGQGTLPLMDVLFGITEIDAEDQKEIDGRPTVYLTPRGSDGGDFATDGPEEITVQGVFANLETYFRMPPKVRGRYVIDAPDGVNPDGVNIRSVTLIYDPKHAVELGEPHMGMAFFARTNHTVISRDGLAFFLDDNAGPNPDRCYHVVPE
jgi:hypothetical protein